MTKHDIIDKFEAYETEATFTRGNKMTTQVVAMDDIKTVVDRIVEDLEDESNKEPRFSVSLVYQNTENIMLRCLILSAKDESNALVETMDYFAKEAEGFGLILKTVIKIKK